MIELIQPFDLNLYQRALLACLVIGFINGYASAFVLLNRSPLKLTALSHSLLPGIALASWLVGLSVISAFLGSILMATTTGLLAIYFSQRSKLSQDTSLAVLYTGFFALGIILLNRVGSVQDLETWLFGNILGLSNLDLWMSFIIGCLALGVFSIYRRAIIITIFEPQIAKTLGVKTQWVYYGGFALLIMILVTTLQAVGCVLTIGLVVTPAATIRQFTYSVDKLFIWSGLLGAVGSVAGLLLSYHLDMPAGASIVVVLTLCFVLAFSYRQFRLRIT